MPFNSNHTEHCLTNTPFSLAIIIFIIVENTDIRMFKLEELKSLFNRSVQVNL